MNRSTRDDSQRGHADSATREAILDAAAQLLAEEGYAAVTTRRIAARASVTSPLIYYYFGTLDDVFVEIFRRHADRALAQQTRLLAGDQPLWALWDMTLSHDYAAISVEFLALANHRPAVRAAVAHYGQAFREMQAKVLTEAFHRNGVESSQLPPVAVVLLLHCVANVLTTESATGLEVGHQELTALVERQLREIEGPRRRPAPRTPDAGVKPT